MTKWNRVVPFITVWWPKCNGNDVLEGIRERHIPNIYRGTLTGIQKTSFQPLRSDVCTRLESDQCLTNEPLVTLVVYSHWYMIVVTIPCSMLLWLHPGLPEEKMTRIPCERNLISFRPILWGLNEKMSKRSYSLFPLTSSFCMVKLFWSGVSSISWNVIFYDV